MAKLTAKSEWMKDRFRCCVFSHECVSCSQTTVVHSAERTKRPVCPDSEVRQRKNFPDNSRTRDDGWINENRKRSDHEIFECTRSEMNYFFLPRSKHRMCQLRSSFTDPAINNASLKLVILVILIHIHIHLVE